jgi:hypothetical protein
MRVGVQRGNCAGSIGREVAVWVGGQYTDPILPKSKLTAGALEGNAGFVGSASFLLPRRTQQKGSYSRSRRASRVSGPLSSEFGTYKTVKAKLWHIQDNDSRGQTWHI